MGIGAIQTGIAASEAANLPDPQQHTVSPELRKSYNMAFQETQRSWAPGEVAMYQQGEARRGTAMKQMFRNVGFSAAGSAAEGIMNVDGWNKFMAQGADNKRQAMGNLHALSRDVQGVKDTEVDRSNIRLFQEETALGTAKQAGIGNIFGGMDAASNSMQTDSAIATYDKMGKKGEDEGGGFDPNNLPSWLQKMGSNNGWWG